MQDPKTQDARLKPINDFLNLFKEGEFDYLKNGLTQFNFALDNIPSVDEIDLSLICQGINHTDFLTILSRYYKWGIQKQTDFSLEKLKIYRKLFDLLLARAAHLNIPFVDVEQTVIATLAETDEKKENTQTANQDLKYIFQEYLSLKADSKYIFFDQTGKLWISDSLEEAQAKCNETLQNINKDYKRIHQEIVDLIQKASKTENISVEEFNEKWDFLREIHSGFSINKLKKIYNRMQSVYNHYSNETDNQYDVRNLLLDLEKFLKENRYFIFDAKIQTCYKTNSHLSTFELMLGYKDEYGLYNVNSPIYQVKPALIQEINENKNNIKYDFVNDNIYKIVNCSFKAGGGIKYNKELHTDLCESLTIHQKTTLSTTTRCNPKYQKVFELENCINELEKKYNSAICWDRENVKYKINILKDLFCELDDLIKTNAANNHKISEKVTAWKLKKYCNNDLNYGAILGHQRNWFYQVAKNIGADIKTDAEKAVDNLVSNPKGKAS